MNVQELEKHIIDHIGKDELHEAVNLLHRLFKNSKRLNEVVLQSGRLTSLTDSIRTGTILTEEASVKKNKIRAALLDLVSQVDEHAENHPAIRKEIGAYSISKKKKVKKIKQKHAGKGDNVGRDKHESHQHYYEDSYEPEKKRPFFYYLQVFFTFLLTAGIGGLMFGVFGNLLAKEVGMAIGIGIGILAGLVNASSVKRTKGIL